MDAITFILALGYLPVCAIFWKVIDDFIDMHNEIMKDINNKNKK